MSIYDGYGNWPDIAGLESIADIKSKITGHKKLWRPNFCSPQIAYVMEYAAEEQQQVDGTLPTALDFGCGLGRNGPLLKRFFKDVIGIDLPEMVDRLKSAYPTAMRELYRHVYDSVADVARRENFSLVYDSVVLQHIRDSDYIATVLDALGTVKSLRTFVSVHNEHGEFPHLALLRERGWNVWHTEVERLSFEGAPHTVTAFRRN